MSYQVRFTNTTKTPITVDDQTYNTEKNVTFVGKNVAGYSQTIAENFLHLLENFARNTAPGTGAGEGQPVQGQLWYDTTTGVENQLKLFNGSNWVPAGNVKKSTVAPITAVIGDLWVDTDNKQLYLWNGSGWVLVGPQYSTGTKTGTEVEVLTGIDDKAYPVLTSFVNDLRVMIISTSDFVPKTSTLGFTTIKQGANISSFNFNSTTTGNKLWGTAQQADSLLIDSVAVAASNFLRLDQESTTNYGFNVRNNSGLKLGGDLSLAISVDNTAATIFNKASGSSIDFKFKGTNANLTPVRINADSVGINKTNPTESLDVSGNIKTDGRLVITGTDDIGSLSTGSIVTAGGVTIAKSLSVGAGLEVYDTARFSDTAPLTDNLYDSGTTTVRWKKVWAHDIDASGTISGSFSGFLTGSISGAAGLLTNATTFSIGDKLDNNNTILQKSDVVADGVSFNGSTANGKVVLTASISSSFISNKSEATFSYGSDELLINRSGSLKRISKDNFFKNVATMPAGAIIPFGGTKPPTGYLLCDGSEVSIASYPKLFAVIQYNYKPLSSLVGISTFGLPDLRGRFPLGRDDMSNTSTSNPANRVGSTSADIIGDGGGGDTASITKNNLPEHVHDMKGDAGSQFFAFGPYAGNPPDGNAQSANGLVASGQGQLMVDSGGVFMDDMPSPALNVPVNIMNPFQTINYIIFTGEIA